MKNLRLEKKHRQKGQALIMAVVFLLALTFLGMGLIMISAIDISSSRNLRLAEEALSSSEEGLLFGIAYASNPGIGVFDGVTTPEYDAPKIISGDPAVTITPLPALQSVTYKGNKDPHQFLVTLAYTSDAAAPPGFGMGTTGAGPPSKFQLVHVISRGMVLENAGDTFDLNKPPPVQRVTEAIIRKRDGGSRN